MNTPTLVLAARPGRGRLDVALVDLRLVARDDLAPLELAHLFAPPVPSGSPGLRGSPPPGGRALTAVSSSFSGVQSSATRMTLVGISNLASLPFLHSAVMSLSTAATTFASSQTAPRSPDTPSEAASFMSGPSFGQMSAMQYDIEESAYTIGSAVYCDVLSTFSTLERATYSPCCAA